MKKWNFWKHGLASLIMAVLFNYLWGYITYRQAASIGIIGGSDGPTAIFVSGLDKSTAGLWALIIFTKFLPGIVAFFTLLMLYIPLKKAWKKDEV